MVVAGESHYVAPFLVRHLGVLMRKSDVALPRAMTNEIESEDAHVTSREKPVVRFFSFLGGPTSQLPNESHTEAYSYLRMSSLRLACFLPALLNLH